MEIIIRRFERVVRGGNRVVWRMESSSGSKNRLEGESSGEVRSRLENGSLIRRFERIVRKINESSEMESSGDSKNHRVRFEVRDRSPSGIPRIVEVKESSGEWKSSGDSSRPEDKGIVWGLGVVIGFERAMGEEDPRMEISAVNERVRVQSEESQMEVISGSNSRLKLASSSTGSPSESF